MNLDEYLRLKSRMRTCGTKIIIMSSQQEKLSNTMQIKNKKNRSSLLNNFRLVVIKEVIDNRLQFKKIIELKPQTLHFCVIVSLDERDARI